MKEFIDKLIERLEEKAKHDEQRAIKADETESISLITGLQAMADRYRTAIEIVNQLAEEYSSKSSSLETDLTIIQSLPSLYPLQTFEEEAVHRVVEFSHRTEDLVIGVSNSNDGWIPCSERLPEEQDIYIVQRKAGVTFDVFLVNEKRFANIDVIAWQPLPAPYQPKGE